MEKFEPNNLEVELEAEGQRVNEELGNLRTNVEEIGSLNLPKGQEERVMRRVLTKLEMLQAAIVGLGTGLGFTVAIQEAMRDPSPYKVGIAVAAVAGAWLADYRTAMSFRKE